MPTRAGGPEEIWRARPHQTPSAVRSGNHEFAAAMFDRACRGDEFAAEVVARWAAEGHAETWALLLREAERMASSLLLRSTGRRDRDLVEDVAQRAVADVCVMLKEGRFDYSRATRFRGLLRVIISRTIAKAVVHRARENRRRGEYAASVAAGLANSARGDDMPTRGDRDAVTRAVSSLPEPERTAVVLHARGMTLEQIGEQIGFSSKSGVRRVLRRGLVQAMEAVREQEGMRTGARREASRAEPEGGGPCSIT